MDLSGFPRRSEAFPLEKIPNIVSLHSTPNDLHQILHPSKQSLTHKNGHFGQDAFVVHFGHDVIGRGWYPKIDEGFGGDQECDANV